MFLGSYQSCNLIVFISLSKQLCIFYEFFSLSLKVERGLQLHANLTQCKVKISGKFQLCRGQTSDLASEALVEFMVESQICFLSLHLRSYHIHAMTYIYCGFLKEIFWKYSNDILIYLLYLRKKTRENVTCLIKSKDTFPHTTGKKKPCILVGYFYTIILFV